MSIFMNASHRVVTQTLPLVEARELSIVKSRQATIFRPDPNGTVPGL
jgi:hypothetical protein